MMSKPTEGARYALLAYAAWGLFPIYWKLLQHVPAAAILCQRIFWSFCFFSLMRFFWMKEKPFQFRLSAKQGVGILISSVLIGANWFLYIWAVNTGHIVETSLGYFINPLVNIALGVFLLGERLERDQKIAGALALLGVLILTVESGRLPWIALVLAATFSLYGFVRKKIAVPSVEGGQIESFVMLLPVLVAVFAQDISLQGSPRDWFFFVGAGVVTGLPLIWFVEATKRLPYYLMGFFQYLAPTLQFLTGVLIFREPLSEMKLVGFAFIWSGILWMLWRLVRRLRARAV